MADDLGWMDLHCQGNAKLNTPALDQLTAEGMRITEAYATSLVCPPTRAAIPPRWIRAEGLRFAGDTKHPLSAISAASGQNVVGCQSWLRIMSRGMREVQVLSGVRSDQFDFRKVGLVAVEVGGGEG